MPPPSDAYRKATERARARSNALRLAALRNLDKALLEYAEGLQVSLGSLPPDRAAAVAKMARITLQLRERLHQRMNEAVTKGRDVSFNEILKLQQEATEKVFKSKGVDPALLQQIQMPNLTMAGQWESLGKGAATWKTLLRGYVTDAVSDAQQIVTRALLEGMSPDELAKRLRPYVLGAEPFQEAFKGAGEITDKILKDPTQTGAAKRLRFNADRIAFSEIHNARGEAELQAFAQDPFVEAVRWQLSPNRGKVRRPDACDGLANTDFFGMGKGVYPVSQVPTFPHPFCRCERVPIPRGIEDMHKPKPNPPRKGDVKVQGTGCKH